MAQRPPRPAARAGASRSSPPSRESGNEAAEALAHTALAGTGLEEGDLDTWEAESAAADDIARRRRLTYVEYALHFVRLNLTLLADDAEAADQHAEAMRTMREGMATPAMEWNEFGVLYATASGGRGPPSRWPGACSSSSTPTPNDFGRTPLLHVLALAGMEDELRAELARAPLPPLRDNWYLSSEASVRAVVAGVRRRRGAGPAQRRASSRPLSGRMAVSGISVVIGPVDGYLAIALAVARRARCRRPRFADRAEALATAVGDVGLPAVVRRRAGAVRVLGRLSEQSSHRRRSGRRGPRPLEPPPHQGVQQRGSGAPAIANIRSRAVVGQPVQRPPDDERHVAHRVGLPDRRLDGLVLLVRSSPAARGAAPRSPRGAGARRAPRAAR